LSSGAVLWGWGDWGHLAVVLSRLVITNFPRRVEIQIGWVALHGHGLIVFIAPPVGVAVVYFGKSAPWPWTGEGL